MPFQPGNKIGKGRPKGSGYVQFCREWAERKGWTRLIDLAQGKGFTVKGAGPKRESLFVQPDPKVQLSAIQTLLAYAYGKPSEKLDITSGGVSIRDWFLSEVAKSRGIEGHLLRLSESGAPKSGVVPLECVGGDSVGEAD